MGVDAEFKGALKPVSSNMAISNILTTFAANLPEAMHAGMTSHQANIAATWAEVSTTTLTSIYPLHVPRPPWQA